VLANVKDKVRVRNFAGKSGIKAYGVPGPLGKLDLSPFFRSRCSKVFSFILYFCLLVCKLLLLFGLIVNSYCLTTEWKMKR
jgi:hypothetical protein